MSLSRCQDRSTPALATRTTWKMPLENTRIVATVVRLGRGFPLSFPFPVFVPILCLGHWYPRFRVLITSMFLQLAFPMLPISLYLTLTPTYWSGVATGFLVFKSSLLLNTGSARSPSLLSLLLCVLIPEVRSYRRHSRDCSQSFVSSRLVSPRLASSRSRSVSGQLL
ncbi:hypothetical protein EDB89DRAFT_793951 [Lactarius sanguifluus]|nr:hypothetical protein EDB89DRAFT_793951 [Lactarius sanguifluus]